MPGIDWASQNDYILDKNWLQVYPHPPTAMQNSNNNHIFPTFSSVPENSREVTLDGVTYAILRHKGRTWNLGSVNPAWKELLGGLASTPDAESLARLASQGVWLAEALPPEKLAVMCCGLGSCWPGMGRELYENFPVARAAMQYLADLSAWDLLGIMEEDKLENISQTSIQIIYLFMLEYAQWKLFVSLGLEPAMICGHSLGELVALCLAGVYDEKGAWFLFEKRAEHITELEKKSANETGMLAVHAGEDIIKETLARWPTLALANRNTSRQFILGGPKPDLLAARKDLRKRRIAAMMLNVPLAFHNPAMRILRDFSVRRLNGLEMRVPRMPVLSNVTTGFYPQKREEICDYIADLDENAVAWNECVQAMRDRDGIKIFLELGPAETLCGLVEEIAPGSIVLAADHRERETDTIRATLARLFALGHLDYEKIVEQKKCRFPEREPFAGPSNLPERTSQAAPDAGMLSVFELVAKAAGKQVSEISADMDLRYDLALRSSSFPRLLQEAEKSLGCRAEYESLLQVSTVGDLARVLLGEKIQAPGTKKPPIPRTFRAALRRFELVGAKRTLAAPKLLIYQRQPEILPGKDDVILLYGQVGSLGPQILNGLARAGSLLVVPPKLENEFCRIPGSRIETFDAFGRNGEIADIVKETIERFGRLDGIIFLDSEAEGLPDEIASKLSFGMKDCEKLPWLLMARRITCQVGSEFLTEYARWLEGRADFIKLPHARMVAIADNGQKIGVDELGDTMALELMYGQGAVFWAPPSLFEGVAAVPQLFARGQDFPLALVDHSPPAQSGPGQFQGITWWSSFAPSRQDDFTESTLESLREGEKFQLARSREFLAILQGAKRLFPWLEPLGFSDMHFFETVEIPFGIARECRLECRARYWFNYDGMPTRLVDVSLAQRKLSANGRRMNDYEMSIAGCCLLSARKSHARPIEPLRPENLILKPGGALPPFPRTLEEEPIDCGALYTIAGIAPGRRLVKNIRKVGPDGYSGSLEPFSIAMRPKGDYAGYLHMFESLLQAADLVLASSSAPQFLGKWNCGGVGYLNFDMDGLFAGENLSFQLRQVWQAQKFARFNAQVGDGTGRIFLVAYNIEYECALSGQNRS